MLIRIKSTNHLITIDMPECFKFIPGVIYHKYHLNSFADSPTYSSSALNLTLDLGYNAFDLN